MELHSDKAKNGHSLHSTFVNLGFDKETVCNYAVLFFKVDKLYVSLIKRNNWLRRDI